MRTIRDFFSTYGIRRGGYEVGNGSPWTKRDGNQVPLFKYYSRFLRMVHLCTRQLFTRKDRPSLSTRMKSDFYYKNVENVEKHRHHSNYVSSPLVYKRAPMQMGVTIRGEVFGRSARIMRRIDIGRTRRSPIPEVGMNSYQK